MFNFFAGPRLGLEITSRALRLGVFAGKSGSITLLASKTAELPSGAVNEGFGSPNIADNEGLAGVLRAALRDIAPRAVQRAGLSLPDGVFRTQLIEFDDLPAGRDERGRLVRWRLEKTAAFDMEKTVLRLQVWRRPERGFTVLACVAKQDVISQYEDALAAIGIEPWTVAPSSFHVLNLYAGAIAAKGIEHYALVWIDSSSSSTIIMERGCPRFYRYREIKSGPAGEPSGRLLREIDDSLHFYMHLDRQQPSEVGRLYLAGDAAIIDGLAERLAQTVSTGVDVLTPDFVHGAAGGASPVLAAAFGAGGVL